MKTTGAPEKITEAALSWTDVPAYPPLFSTSSSRRDVKDELLFWLSSAVVMSSRPDLRAVLGAIQTIFLTLVAGLANPSMFY